MVVYLIGNRGRMEPWSLALSLKCLFNCNRILADPKTGKFIFGFGVWDSFSDITEKNKKILRREWKAFLTEGRA